MTKLVDHARLELALIGVDDKTIELYAKVIQAFADMNLNKKQTSGAIENINNLLQFNNLSPITDNVNEWVQIGDPTRGSVEGIWQNIRNSEAFSNDGGRTYYFLSNIQGTETSVPSKKGQASDDGPVTPPT